MTNKFGWSYPAGAASDPHAPYNQDDFVIEDAIAERDLLCPACQETAVWFRDVEKAGFPNDLTHDEVTTEGWHCENCDWQQESVPEDYDRLQQFKASFQPRIDAVNEILENVQRKPPLEVDDIFSDYCPDGDFEWLDTEAGDWHIFCCGEKDCPQQWHKVAFYTDIGREDGKRWIELRSCDEDGNHDYDCGYDERPPSNQEPCEFGAEVGDSLAAQSDDYFKGWAQYWLDCANTGKDPCNAIIGAPPADWLEFCIKSAEDMAKYLLDGRHD